MPEYGLYKNSEGYADPTYADAIKGMAKAGEIWLYKDREVLIVKNQGTYCNILQLSNKWKPNSIAVAEFYAQPGMLSYAFNDLLGECVDKLTDDEFRLVTDELTEVLQVPVITKEVPKGEECVNTTWLHEENEKLRITICEKDKELMKLRGQVELLKDMYSELLRGRA